jgi:transcriptional regulator with XRE-family HTH domain
LFDEVNMATIGERIRDVRERRRMTLDQLVERSGVSKGFLSDVENDKRSPNSEYLLKIANALGASVDFLLRGEEHEALVSEPVVIPAELSRAAEELHLTYAETLEVLKTHDSVVAKRTDRGRRRFDEDDWKSLHAALKKAFG